MATAYGEIARRTQEMGILPCLHPEIGTVVPDLKALKVFLEYSDPSAMLLCLDTGFLQQGGVPAIKFIRENKGKIGSVHLRDVKPLPGKKKKDAVPQYHTVELGKGQVELEEIVDTLLEIEFTGWATVELEKGSKTLMAQSKNSYEYAAHELDLVL